MNEIENDLTIVDTYAKIDSVMEKYKGKNVYISYSGGSDSDTIAWLFKNRGYDIPLVFFDTGIEYKATYDHIEEMIKRGFNIEVAKPKKSIGVTTKKYGIPFISKVVSGNLYYLQKHGFDFFTDGKKDIEFLLEKFPNAKTAVKWWTNTNGIGRFNINRNKLLKEFLTENGLPFKVSGRCCDITKKNVAKNFCKKNNVDMMILGIRKSEGGIRSSSYQGCFIPKQSKTYDMYFPMFWWNQEIKKNFDEKNNIFHSICYKEYGLKRTGCVACPFARDFQRILDVLEEYEPNSRKVAISMFEESYIWTKKYHDFKDR